MDDCWAAGVRHDRRRQEVNRNDTFEATCSLAPHRNLINKRLNLPPSIQRIFKRYSTVLDSVTSLNLSKSPVIGFDNGCTGYKTSKVGTVDGKNAWVYRSISFERSGLCKLSKGCIAAIPRKDETSCVDSS